MDNTTVEQTQVEWRWHRRFPHLPIYKSHLVREISIMFRDGHIVYQAACGYAMGIGSVSESAEPNNDMSAPCKRCLRASAGLNVGKG